MSIFLRLREERKRLGMTQEAFGTAGGVLKGAVINYEKGERAPDVMFLAGIASAGADVLYIITGTPTPRGTNTYTAQELALLESYAQADEEGRAALQGVANLAARTAIKASGAKGSNTVNIAGKVEQSIAGNATFSAPVSFGGRKQT